MSTRTIDEKVVSMKFDNKEFEQKVKQTMNTVSTFGNKLKETNNINAFANINKSINNVDFSGITTGISELQERFSTAGIVAMTTISEITRGAIRLVSTGVSKIKNLITTGGINRAMNIEKAKFQLEGLGIAYSDMYDAIDYAVTDTAYSLDAAAQAASQLATSGLDYKNVVLTHKADNKELTNMSMALRAISGVAAQTQTDYATVARYFQDVANAGALAGAQVSYMTQVLNLPVKQNLVTGLNNISKGLIEASDNVQRHVEQITKKREIDINDLDELIKKKMIDFETFSTIMFGLYADHAVKANETIEGVKSNIKSAFAKIGADFFEPIIANKGPLVDLLEEFRRSINGIRKNVQPVSHVFSNEIVEALKKITKYVKNLHIDDAFKFDSANLQIFLGDIKKLVSLITDIMKPMKTAFEEVFGVIDGPTIETNRSFFLMLGRNLTELRDNMAETEKRTGNLKKVFKGLFSFVDLLKQAFQALLEPVKMVLEKFGIISSTVGDAAGSIGEWITALDESAKSTGFFVEAGQKMAGVVSIILNSIQALKTRISETGSGLKGFDKVKVVIIETLRTIVNGILSIIEKLTGLDASKLKGSIDSIADFLEENIGRVRNALMSNAGIKGTIERFKTWFENLDVNDSVIKKIYNYFSDDETSALQKFLNGIGALFRSAVNLLASIIPTLDKLITGLGAGLKKMVDLIGEAFSNPVYQEFKSKQMDQRLLLFMTILTNALRNFLDSANPLTHVLGKITTPLNKFLNALNRFTKISQLKQVANLIKSIAAAILVLCVSLYILSSADADGLASGVMAMTALIGELMALCKILIPKKNIGIGGLITMMGITEALIQVSASILILAIALKMVASCPIDAMWNAFAIIEGLLVTVGVISKLLSSKKPGKIIGGLDELSSMAGAILVLAIAFKMVVNAMQGADDETILQAFLIIETMLVSLALVAQLLSTGPGKNAKKMMSGISGFIAMALSIVILSFAFKNIISALKECNNEEAWGAFGILEGMLLSLALVAKILSSTKAGKSLGGAVAFIGIAAALAIMVNSFKSLVDAIKSSGGEEILNAFLILEGLLLSLTVVLQLLSSEACDPGKMLAASAAMIVMALAIKVLSSAVIAMSALDAASIALSGGALIAFVGAIALLASIVDPAEVAGLGAGMLIMSAALVVFAGAMAIMTSLDLEAVGASIVFIIATLGLLAVGASALSATIPALMGLSIAFALFGAGLVLVGTGILVIIGALAALEGCLDKLIDITSKLVTALLNMLFTEILPELANFMAELVPALVDALLKMLVMVLDSLAQRIPEILVKVAELVMNLFAGLSEVLKKVDPDVLKDGVLAIAALSAIFLEVAICGVTAILAMVGMGAIYLCLALMSKIMSSLKDMDLFSLLPMVDQLTQVIDRLGDAMIKMALFGGLGAIGTATMLPVVGTMVAMLTALGGLSQIPGFDWLVGEGGKVLAQIGGIIGEFVGSMISGFGVGLASGLPEIGTSLSEFMINAMPFIAGCMVIDNKFLDSVKALSAAILLITGADLVKQLVSFITLGDPIKGFGESLDGLGGVLKTFGTSIDGLDADAVEDAAYAAKALAEFASAIPNSGGAIADWTGDNQLSKFAEELALFGPAFKAYADSVSGMDSDAVTKSADAAMAIAKFAAELPNSGGFVADWTGDNLLSSFAEELLLFGPSFKEYAESIKGMDPDAVTKSADAAASIAKFAGELPNDGGFVAYWTGDNLLADFGEALAAFGPNFKKYSDAVSGIDGDVVSKTTAAAMSLSELAANLPNSGGVASWFSGDNTLDDFGAALATFGYYFSAYYNTVSGIDGGKAFTTARAIGELANVATILNGVDSHSFQWFADGLNSLAKVDATAIFEAFNDTDGSVNGAIANFFALINGALQEHQDEMTGIIQEMLYTVDTYLDNDGKSLILSSISTLLVETVMKIRDYYQRMYEAGTYIAQGFIEGMKSKIDQVALEATKMAKAAFDAVMTETDSHSPSRKFKKVGGYVGEGFALGIEKYYGRVYDASAGLASASSAAMNDTIGDLVDIVESNMDFSPTIRPTLDLTNVRNGAKEIGSLLNNGSSKASAVYQNGGKVNADGSITYNQYNYSPKALSRIDIYRQTKNALSASRI